MKTYSLTTLIVLFFLFFLPDLVGVGFPEVGPIKIRV